MLLEQWNHVESYLRDPSRERPADLFAWLGWKAQDIDERYPDALDFNLRACHAFADLIEGVETEVTFRERLSELVEEYRPVAAAAQSR